MRRSALTQGARYLPLLAMVVGTTRVQAGLVAGDTMAYGGDDKLTVRLHGTTPTDMLTELARVTGAKLVGGAKDAKPVVAEFDAVPINEALHRLLGDQNFTLVFAKTGKLSKIRLHGGPLATTAAVASIAVAPVAPPSPMAVVGMIENHAPLAIGGQLSQVLGTTSATFRQLFEVATRNEDQALRNESLRVIMNAIESEPELRAQFVTSIKAVDDATVSQFIRGAAGDRAEELLVRAATQARGSEMRVKASAVLQHLRAQGSGG